MWLNRADYPLPQKMESRKSRSSATFTEVGEFQEKPRNQETQKL
jgi:hypothetical protein